MFYLHLERIEMTGFKSFADKTVIEFDKGVTAVVGPNGSGKSNLSEAIRWVLGEQSAKNLRGKKMDDIVFAGSQSRKPVNIAEVTLLFNNEDQYLPIDFSQVSITRRINRNGESSCFINKKPCRLKDITDLLMDSGIGKDSFSMISQGKVEQIFQSKPEERRSIFEEAAGIAKYKHRKGSAKRKLEHTEEHLNRVEDILHEINNQRAPLEVQRNTALLYQEKKKELSTIEIALIAVEIETVNQQWQLSKKELLQYTNQVKQLDETQSETQVELIKLKEQLNSLNNELDSIREEHTHVIKKIEQVEGQKNIVEQTVQFSKKNKVQQQVLIEEKIKKVEEQKVHVNTLLNQNKEKLLQKNVLQNKILTLEQKEQQLSQDKNKWIQELRENYIEKLQLQSSTNNLLLNKRKEKERISERMKNLKEKIRLMQLQTDDCTNLLAKKSKDILDFKENTGEQEVKLTTIHKRLEELKIKEESLNQKQVTFSKNIQLAEARKESQLELETSYATYYQGVKAILKRRATIQGVHGPVGELFQVSEQYTLALESALGGAIQHVVVTNPDSASKCISILKSNHLGKATFLPLSVIKGKMIPKQIVREIESNPGFVGIASNLVDYQKQYENIATNLLGTTIISKDLESGISISQVVQNRYRIVSLEGDIIHSGGSMTGGATKKQQNSSVFDRRNTIKKLEVYLFEQKSSYQKLKVEHDLLQQKLSQYRKELEKMKQTVNESRFSLDKLIESKDRDTTQITLLQEEKNNAEYEEKQLSKQLIELLHQVEQEEKLKQTLFKEIENIKMDMQNSTMNEEERVNILSSIQKELQSNKQSIAVLLEQEKHARKDLITGKNIIDTETHAIKAIEENLKSDFQIEKTEKEEIEKLVHSLKQLNQDKKRIEEDVKIKRKSKKEIELATENNEQQLQESTRLSKEAWKIIAQLESSSSRYEVAIDHYLNRLSEEYELSFESAREDYILPLTTEEASERVGSLKKEIEELGVVNLASIGEFERISDRFDFLSLQQNDLVTAKLTLLDTMGEMDKEVSTRFEKKFKEIKAQFEITFPKLFGGGKATIQLTDPTNLLETGIEIIAQPPGKMLQQLSLLSGGEKAFTAIALLFSIIEVSSIPFCILDEVEAALDEANVSRFGRYLGSFDSKTQFIIITHRKGTMEEADVLYGITMQDSGVSKLASVRFEDRQRVAENTI